MPLRYLKHSAVSHNEAASTADFNAVRPGLENVIKNIVLAALLLTPELLALAQFERAETGAKQHTQPGVWHTVNAIK